MIQGLKVTETIKTKKSNIIVSHQYKVFKTDELDIYKDNFNKMFKDIKVQGIFEDSEWKVSLLERKLDFQFNFEFNLYFNNSLKSFVVTEVYNNNNSIKNLHGSLAVLKRVASITGLFSKDMYDYLEEYLLELSDGTRNQYSSLIIEFLSFSQVADYEFYIDKLSKVRARNVLHNRVIPNYTSILTFDSIINDYMFNCDESKQLKYKPLILWWEITRVIPLRPAEFVLIKRNCLSKKNNKFYITVPRIKTRSLEEKVLKIDREDTLAITEEIYNLVDNHLKNVIGKEKYLLPYSLYLSSMDYWRREKAIQDKYNPELFWTTQFSYLLNNFYTEIVEGEYKYNTILTDNVYVEVENNTLQRIRPGDTRHLAFCSMMLQGFNPLTIARIGGHTSLRTQRSYYSHLESFIDASSTMLAKQIKRILKTDENGLNIYNNVFVTRDSLLNKMMLEKTVSTTSYRRLENGFCLSDNFPKDCPPNTDCIFCLKHIRDNSDKSMAKEQSEKLKSLKKDETNKQIAFLVSLLNKYDKSDKCNISIKSTAEEITRSVTQEAMIKSYTLKIMEVKNND